MMADLNLLPILYLLLILGLVVLFVISLVLFVKRIVENNQKRAEHYQNIEKKLDDIIALVKEKSD
ncbi:DUF4083 family protein [Gracilibacillus timonensis]|uniref:DUF4083 family protein n=1 Tax=Gracilibacillus timonensis TaxID=1816696 RepID=UPI001F1F2BB8|nr:DUF4083 family protein [Gracilibacillus timonensis]